MGNFLNNYIFWPIGRFFRGLAHRSQPKKPPQQNGDDSPTQRIALKRSASEHQPPQDLGFTLEDQQLLKQYGNIVNQLAAKPNKNQEDLDEMGYAYAQLATTYSKYDNNDYQRCLRSAIAIYDSLVQNYYEEKITLLNNVGLNLDSRGLHTEAIQLFREAITMADIYLPRADQRSIVIKNNLACALMSNNNQREGKLIFESCIQQTVANKQANLQELLDKNLSYHTKIGLQADLQEKRSIEIAANA